MSLRRGECARLEAAGWTVSDQPVVAAAGSAGGSAVVAVSREYRALGRELRPGPGIKGRSVWGRLVGWVFRHLPEIIVVVVLIRIWQLTAAQIGPLWTNILSVGLVVGLVGWVRRWLTAMVGCMVTRARLRAAFQELRLSRRSGRLPFTVALVPTAVGERVWLCCPPGVSAEDIASETDPAARRLLRPRRPRDPRPPVLRPGPGRGDPPRPARRHHARHLTTEEVRGDFDEPQIDVDAAALAGSIRQAAAHIRLTVEMPDGTGLVLRFGEQLDTQTVNGGATGELTPEHAARYIAKYATKSAEDFDLGDRRISPETLPLLGVSDHVDRLVRLAWRVGEHAAYDGLRRWVHMLGFRGHFTSKSRCYSTTLGVIRGERRAYRQHQATEHIRGLPADEQDMTLVVARWEFAGLGYRTTGDAALALSAADRARERRQAARDAA